jgi:hypothetical protein
MARFPDSSLLEVPLSLLLWPLLLPLFTEVPGRVILRTSPPRSSEKFGLLLIEAVMFADGPLVVLIRRDVRVRKGRCALHALLVHP